MIFPLNTLRTAANTTTKPFLPTIMLGLASFVLLTMVACSSDDSAKAGDKLLAKAYNKRLYRSDLEGIVPEGAADTALIMDAYIQRWLHDQLLMYEAERNIPKDLNIDELVRDYRASLVRHNFEEKIISERLDSVVQESELRNFYEKNKEQFQLETTILKCYLLKVPSSAPQNELNKIWYARDREKLAEFAKNWATVSLLDPEKWYRLDEIAAILPKGTLTADNVGSRGDGTLNDSGFRYYYRVLQNIRNKETAPFDYVREQASKVILHRRKQELLEKWKEELYQKELRRENIKIVK